MFVWLTAGFNSKLFNCNFLRIIPISRPVILSELLLKVKTAYGEELSMNYVSNEVNLTSCTLFFENHRSTTGLVKLDDCLSRMPTTVEPHYFELSREAKNSSK